MAILFIGALLTGSFLHARTKKIKTQNPHQLVYMQRLKRRRRWKESS